MVFLAGQWEVIGGQWDVMGGYGIWVIGGAGGWGILGIFGRHLWRYLEDFLGYNGDILRISWK